MRSSLVQLPFRSTRRFLSSGSQPHLRIVAVNDVYEVHGLPRLKSLVAKHRREQEQHGGVLLTTLAGDFVSPSILSGMDQGQSMVQTLAAIPISHCCFGNHEADLKLDDLSRRVVEFEAAGCRWLNSNMPKFRPALPLWDIVDVPLAGLRVGILGLLTSEKGVFRKDTFRGLPIEDVVSTATRLSATLRAEHGVGAVVALTHQSVTADLALAQSGAVDLILGGHEHEVMEHRPEGGVPVIKAGSDAHTAAVVDVTFGAHVTARGGAAMAVGVTFEDVAAHAPEPELEAEVSVHLSVLRALETEAVCSAAFLPRLAGLPLTSERTRFEQTTVGMLLASTVRDALQAQVGMINGGTIKGNTSYASGELTYLALQRELPFPTKMVVVGMPAPTLQAAILASRAGDPAVEKRAYLQLDDGVEVDDAAGQLVAVAGRPYDEDATYTVALPRNLLKGAFEIAPLVRFAQEHADALPDEDAFVPALNLIIMQQAKHIWRRLGSFDELDLDGDGELTRDEIVAGLRAKLGREPSAIMVSNVMEALDADASGSISREEFEALETPPLTPPPLRS